MYYVVFEILYIIYIYIYILYYILYIIYYLFKKNTSELRIVESLERLVKVVLRQIRLPGGFPDPSGCPCAVQKPCPAIVPELFKQPDASKSPPRAPETLLRALQIRTKT